MIKCELGKDSLFVESYEEEESQILQDRKRGRTWGYTHIWY